MILPNENIALFADLFYALIVSPDRSILLSKFKLLEMYQSRHFSLMNHHWDDSTNTINSLQRVNLHTSVSGLQVMILKIPSYFTYGSILDDCDGLITFTLITGALYIDTLDCKGTILESYFLSPGELLVLPRNIFRKTYTLGQSAVYIEHIEDGYRPSARRKLINL